MEDPDYDRRSRAKRLSNDNNFRRGDRRKFKEDLRDRKEEGADNQDGAGPSDNSRDDAEAAKRLAELFYVVRSHPEAS